MISKKNLIKNSLSGVIHVIFTAILAFTTIPIFIGKLGFEMYGVFAVVTIVGNLNSLANFGLNGALLINLAKQGKCKKSNIDIVVTLLFISLISAFFSAIAIFFRGFIISDIFAIPADHIPEAIALLIYLVLTNSLLMIGQTFTAILDSQQKIYLTNFSQFIYSFFYWGSICTIVLLGGKFEEVGVGILFSAIIWFFLVLFLSIKVWGNFKIPDFDYNFKMSIRKQWAYGNKIYFSGLVAFFFEPLSKILLSHFIGLSSAGLFDIGLRVKNQINGLISKGLYPLYPFIASTNFTTDFRKQVYDFSKKIQLFVIPISVLLIFVFPILIDLWLGADNSSDAIIFVTVITVSMIMFSPSKVPIYQFLLAKNHAGKTIIIQLSSVLINIFVFLFFYRIIGLYAILLSNSVAFLTSFIICDYYQIKFFKIKSVDLIRNEAYFIFLFLGIGFPCYLISLMKPIGLSDLFIYPIVCYVFFLIYMKKFHLFSAYDAKFYFTPMGKLGRILELLLLFR